MSIVVSLNTLNEQKRKRLLYLSIYKCTVHVKFFTLSQDNVVLEDYE